MEDDVIHISEEDLNRSIEETIVHISEEDLNPEIVLGGEDVPSLPLPQPELPEIICPFDQHVILSEHNIVACVKCGTPHHTECWQENNGCAVFGCHGKQSKPYVPDQYSQEVLQVSASQTPARVPTREEQAQEPKDSNLLQQLRRILGIS